MTKYAAITATYSFNVKVDACVVSIYDFLTQIADDTIYVPSGALEKRFTVRQTSLNCNFPIIFTMTVDKAVIPSWMNLVDVTQGVESKLTIDNPDRKSVGTYIVTITASIPQVLEVGQIKKINFSFTLIVKDECEISVFDSSKVINDMFAKVS